MYDNFHFHAHTGHPNSCSSNFEVWNIGVTHPRTQATLFRMVALGAAVTNNRLIHPESYDSVELDMI